MLSSIKLERTNKDFQTNRFIRTEQFDMIDKKNQHDSAVDGGGAEGARAPPEFGGSEKGKSLISAYRSLAITTNTPGLKKLSTALNRWRHYMCIFEERWNILND